MDESQTQDRRVSWNQDQPQKRTQDQLTLLQDQVQPHNGTNQGKPSQDLIQPQEDPSWFQQAHRPSLLRKKVQTSVEPRKTLGLTARATAFHLGSSSGLRKAQSVHSLLSDTGNAPA